MWLPKGTGWMTSIIAIYCTYSSWFLVTLCMYTTVNFIPKNWQRNCLFSKLFFWLVIIKHNVTCICTIVWLLSKSKGKDQFPNLTSEAAWSKYYSRVWGILCTRRFYSRFGFAKTYYAISWVVISPNFILKKSLDLAFH